MENPITAIRLRLGISRAQLCQATGLRRDALYLAETGQVNKPQERLLEMLEDLGFSREDVAQKYCRYKQELAAQTRSQIIAHRNQVTA